MDIKIEKATVKPYANRMLDKNWTVEIEDGGHWPPDGPERDLLKKRIEEVLMEEILKDEE